MVHPKHPSFPPNLPTLSSNVSHMRSISVPESTSDIAPAIRNELTSLRNDPTDTLEWLSVAAYRHEQTTIADKGYALVPSEDDVMVNSNLRLVSAPRPLMKDTNGTFHSDSTTRISTRLFRWFGFFECFRRIQGLPRDTETRNYASMWQMEPVENCSSWYRRIVNAGAILQTRQLQTSRVPFVRCHPDVL